MNILIISQYFPPDITAATFRIYDTAILLKKQGHDVRIITAKPHKAQANNDKSERYDSQFSKVLRANIKPINGGGFKNYIKHYLSFMNSSSIKGIRQRLGGWKADVIWASSPPLFVGLTGRFLAKAYRSPLILDVRDIWPDSAVGAGQISANGYAYKIGKIIEKYLYRKADHITCVADPMKQYISSFTATKTSVIYNGVNKEDFINISGAKKDKNPNIRTILYAGNLGRVQQLHLMIKAFSEIRNEPEIAGWQLHLIGSGALENELKTLVAELDLENKVKIYPPISREAAISEQIAADILYISLQPDMVFRRTIPSKVFDYMGCARPILAGIFGEGRELLESTGANICYDPGNKKELTSALLTAVRQYKQNSRKAVLNRELVLSKYTREQGANKLLSIISDIIPEV